MLHANLIVFEFCFMNFPVVVYQKFDPNLAIIPQLSSDVRLCVTKAVLISVPIVLCDICWYCFTAHVYDMRIWFVVPLNSGLQGSGHYSSFVIIIIQVHYF